MKYIMKKMSFREKARVFFLKRKLRRISNKFDKYVLMSHKYQDLLVKFDDKLHDMMHALKIKYA
jgi:hypothetical protein